MREEKLWVSFPAERSEGKGIQKLQLGRAFRAPFPRPDGLAGDDTRIGGEVSNDIFVLFPAERSEGKGTQKLRLGSTFWVQKGKGMRAYFVYILASERHGTLYIGVTSNLAARVAQHSAGTVPGFTKRYGVHRLVYAEVYSEITEAIAREKQLKGWNRAWKVKLIEASNPMWKELDPTSLTH